MKISASAILAVTLMAALAPAQAEAFQHGYPYRSGGYDNRYDYRSRGGYEHWDSYRYRAPSNTTGPLYETRTPNGVVRERRYGNCYVRNVTTYDAYGRKIVRRTTTC